MREPLHTIAWILGNTMNTCVGNQWSTHTAWECLQNNLHVMAWGATTPVIPQPLPPKAMTPEVTALWLYTAVTIEPGKDIQTEVDAWSAIADHDVANIWDVLQGDLQARAAQTPLC